MSEQTAEQIARWAERQDDKKPAGAAGHLSSEQKQQIRAAYLATGGSVTYTEMGVRCASIIGRAVNRDTVAACMKGPEYDALRKHFDTEIKSSAVEKLKAGILPAADAWVRAMENAAEKGDHKPAKDLLMHTGTIEPLDDDGRARGPLVLVAIAPGTYRDTTSGRTLSQEQADALPGTVAYVGDGTFPIGQAPDFSDVHVPIWSDGTRTYTKAEVAEIRSSDPIIMVGGSANVQIGPPPQAEELFRVGGTGEVITREEADRRSAKHETTVQIGASARDVKVGVLAQPAYRIAGSSEVLSQADAEARARAAKQDVLTIGVHLPGIGG